MARYLGIEVTDTLIKGALLKTAYKKLSIEGVYTVYRTPGPEGLAQAAPRSSRAVEHPGRQAAGARRTRRSRHRRVAALDAAAARGLQARAARAGERARGAVPFDVADAMIDALPLTNEATIDLLAIAARTERASRRPRRAQVGGHRAPRSGRRARRARRARDRVPALQRELRRCSWSTRTSDRAELVVLEGGVVRFARTLNGLTTPAARERGIRQSMASYRASGGAAVTAAYLCGEEAAITASILADACGLSADYVGAMPAGDFQIAPTAGETALWEAPVAVALALRGLGRGGARIDFRKGALALAARRCCASARPSWASRRWCSWASGRCRPGPTTRAS